MSPVASSSRMTSPSSPGSSSPKHRPVSPFPPLAPILSSFSQSHRQRPRDDGYDNFPIPLPHDQAALERRLTTDPDVAGQMSMDDDDIGPPPEGGKEAWQCVFGAFFLLFCFFGFFTSFGTLQEYYLENQLRDHTKSDVAWISSVSSFAVFAGSLSAGRYFDSHGARFLTIAGTVLSISALVAVAFCKQYYQFMLAHLLFGISGSFLYSPATAVSGHWFLRKRSTAVGIVVCGSGLGGVIYPIALRRLFDQVGFRDTLLIIAGMNAVLMIPSWFYMKARLPPRTPPPLSSLARPWQESQYICLVIGSCMNMMILFSPYFNAPLYTTSNNASPTITYYSVAFIQAGSFLGRALSGILADTFGVWNVFVINGFGLTVTLLAFWTGVPLPDAVVVIGIISYGFASGAWITLVAASCATISPTREFGMRLGMLWSCTALLQSFGPVICGALVSASDNEFTYAAVFCAMSALVGTTVTIGPKILARLSKSPDEEEEHQDPKASQSSRGKVSDPRESRAL